MQRINSATFVTINVAIIGCAALVVLQPSARELFTFAGALASTFIGAWFAFQFGAGRVKRDKRDKDVSAGNLALVVLVEFLDRDFQYQKQFVDPVRENPNYWWVMRPGQDLDTLDLKVDLAGLAFLLQRHSQVWRAIVLEERRHKLLAKTITERTKLLTEEVFVKFEAAGFGHGQVVTPDEIERVLGPRTTASLKDGTKFIIGMTDDNIKSLESCISIVRNALRELFPNTDFIGAPIKIALAPADTKAGAATHLCQPQPRRRADE